MSSENAAITQDMVHDEVGNADSMLDRPLLVFVCGNNATGKTTLGRALARRLRWLHLPEQNFDQTYLDDLFTAERRWSFEAQLHILTNKVRNVRTAVNKRANALIDRSPYEDAEVFAEGFFDTGRMNARAIKTYRETARELLRVIPSPDVLVDCYAPLPVLIDRVAKRTRPYESLYPDDHIAQLQLAYDDWIGRTARGFPDKVLMVDTSKFDFARDEWAIDAAAKDLIRCLSRSWLGEEGWSSAQLPLFDYDDGVVDPITPFDAPSDTDLLKTSSIAPGLRRHIIDGPAAAGGGTYDVLVPFDKELFQGRQQSSGLGLSRLRAYIAAPFIQRPM